MTKPAETAFYKHFDRHAEGKGIKGSATHYCPGCGHGLIHKYLAEAVAELGIQDHTIAISPVGCSVFLYYYMDVGNTQAAHGRAPAVGLGHKLANPEAIVVSYQGDGDLASIGVAEIMFAAQIGIPFTVIFVNNAIYGMTGGQMAPTTLPGQRSTTTPYGRGPMQGAPFKVAEVMAKLDGSVYVERTALFDLKSRNRTKKAIRKALKLQVERRGFSLVEVLAECPTHLKISSLEAEKWVQENMLPHFPLGVFKNEDREPWFHPEKPSYEPHRVLELVDATTDAPPRFCERFPEHLDPSDVSLKLAGSGGDGAQTAAMLIAKAGINEGYDATHIPSYGPESRGGTSYADVHVAREEVLSPASPQPHVLVAYNAPSLHKFGPAVRENGIVIYDSSVITSVPEVRAGVRLHGVPCAEIAKDLGKTVVKNVVSLGALQAATNLMAEESFLTAIRLSLRSKSQLIALNEEAFYRGVRSFEEQNTHVLE
jgi:2-oxoisovalerate ferredoxin oxidoreductase beta subunit